MLNLKPRSRKKHNTNMKTHRKMCLNEGEVNTKANTWLLTAHDDWYPYLQSQQNRVNMRERRNGWLVVLNCSRGNYKEKLSAVLFSGQS